MSLNKNFGKGTNLEEHEDTASLVHSGGSVYVKKKKENGAWNSCGQGLNNYCVLPNQYTNIHKHFLPFLYSLSFLLVS